MDKKMQLEILKMFISKDSYIIRGEDIIDEINKIFFSRKETIPSSGKIKQQIELLIDDGALVKWADNFPIYYSITEWGYKLEKGGLEKYWYWLINKNHNLISFIAVGISIILPLTLYFLSKK